MRDNPLETDDDVREMIDEIDTMVDEMRICVQYEPQSVLSFFYPWFMLMMARVLLRIALWTSAQEKKYE